MDWSKFADEKIAEAMASGEFEAVTGKGQPLNMDAYFAPRDEDRIACHVLRSSGHVPEEVTLLAEMALLREALSRPCDADRQRDLKERLLLRETEYNMRLERRLMRAPK